MSLTRTTLSSSCKLLAAALTLVIGSSCGEVTEPPPQPNVIIWLVDTLRADHLSSYGYERPTSPRLDALAQTGVLFEQAHVHSNWTQPSVISLLTGLLPPVMDKAFGRRLSDDLLLLPEWLREHGYLTAGISITVATAARYGFAQGYRDYWQVDADQDGRERKGRAGQAFDGERVVDSAIQWFDERRQAGRPFFLYLHTVDPHMPYEVHDDLPRFTGPYDGPQDGSLDPLQNAKENKLFSDADKQNLIDLYDGEVAYSDHQLGRLIDALEQRELLQDTLLVVVSDHGEELFDHKTQGHGHRNLHAELTHVPWVMSWPAGLPAGLRVEPLVRGVDLAPTLVELVGLPPMPLSDGRSLSKLLRAGETRWPDAELIVDRAKGVDDLLALRTAEHLYVSRRDLEPATEAWFDLEHDPSAKTDLADSLPEGLLRAQKTLQRYLKLRAERARSLGATRAVEPSDLATEQLRQLGYLK
ncbi:MAG: arylsulfatase A-like enzyme [Pseudohongiellaceae bacterium]|jgi:arylsulfatase A-like enzyme